MSESNQQKFKKLLAELFMLDQADLDFGIYRIMNAKRAEISQFLDKDLLPQVKMALSAARQVEQVQVEAELKKTEEAASLMGLNPDDMPKIRELRARYGKLTNLDTLENEVFSSLYDFFRRYYNDGDFLSLRRYKPGVYAIPYEGEEVVLHWANKDQYYIKTGEYFRDYAFKLPGGRTVHFKIAEADTEANNNKAETGKERRFILRDDPIAPVGSELVLAFEYRPDARKQADLNGAAVTAIAQALAKQADWLLELCQKRWRRADGAEADKTVLEHRLAEYTARNTFDYFIHKDLGGFLRRELDFYLKNEIMHLDDIENEGVQKIEQVITKLKAIRHIAHKIIDFLAQL
jgi:adenine-specific DNA-methyltransferase